MKNWIPTIQKNKSDVEQGLKEISKLSVDVEESMQQQNRDDDSIGQVQQELKDQQEAIDALMDMLEKTITVEDTHDLLEELEMRLGQKVQDHDDSITEISDEVHGLHDKLEASAEHLVTRIDHVAKKLDEKTGELDSVSRDLASRLEAGFIEAAKTVEQELTELASVFQQQQRALDAQQTQIEAMREQVDLLHEDSDVMRAAVARSEAKRVAERREDAKRADDTLAFAVAMKAEQEAAAKQANEDAERAKAIAQQAADKVAAVGSTMSTALEKLEHERAAASSDPLQVELPADSLGVDGKSEEELRDSILNALSVPIEDVRTVTFDKQATKVTSIIQFHDTVKARDARVQAGGSGPRDVQLTSNDKQMTMHVVPGALEETLLQMQAVREQQVSNCRFATVSRQNDHFAQTGSGANIMRKTDNRPLLPDEHYSKGHVRDISEDRIWGRRLHCCTECSFQRWCTGQRW